MIDIIMVTFNRIEYTKQAVEHLASRTHSPYRLIVVDNGSTDDTVEWLCQETTPVHKRILLSDNCGIHYALNTGLEAVRTPLFVTTDNDILCPDLEPDWLTRLVNLMDRYPQYGAIACRPQILVGEPPGAYDVDDEIIERPHVGSSLRIMRTDMVKSVGGWEKTMRPGRNHEEKWICGLLRKLGYKCGYTNTRPRCRHIFGINWGYQDIPMEVHGHRPIWPLPETYDKIKVDPKTWEPL